MGVWRTWFSSPLALTPSLQRPVGAPNLNLPSGSNKLLHENHSTGLWTLWAHAIKSLSVLTNRSTPVEERHWMAAPRSCLSTSYPPTAWFKCPSPPGSLPDSTNPQWSLKIIALHVIFIWHLFPASPCPHFSLMWKPCLPIWLQVSWGRRPHLYPWVSRHCAMDFGATKRCPRNLLMMLGMMVMKCFHSSLDTNSCRSNGEDRVKKSQIWQTSWHDYSMSHGYSLQKLWPHGMVLRSRQHSYQKREEPNHPAVCCPALGGATRV